MPRSQGQPPSILPHQPPAMQPQVEMAAPGNPAADPSPSRHDEAGEETNWRGEGLESLPEMPPDRGHHPGLGGDRGVSVGADRWQGCFQIDESDDEEDEGDVGADDDIEEERGDSLEEEVDISQWGCVDLEDDVNAWDSLHEDFEQRAHAATLGTMIRSTCCPGVAYCTNPW